MRTTIVFIAMIATVFVADARVISVPDEIPTIQGGIEAADIGDTVLVKPGTYYERLNFLGKNIVVASHFLTSQDTSYISNTVVDGEYAGTVVRFVSGEDSSAVLIGFTITNGYATDGGGILCNSSSRPTLNHLYIRGNTAIDQGGGVLCKNGSYPTVLNSLISENSAGMGGGVCYIAEDRFERSAYDPIDIDGVHSNLRDRERPPVHQDRMVGDDEKYCSVHKSTVVMKNTDITQNSAVLGGGILISHVDNALLEKVNVQDNHAHTGGGIRCDHSELICINVDLSDNTANSGGAIFGDMTKIELYSSHVNYNSATSGGGIYCHFSSTINLINSLMTNNLAYEGGGGICAFSLSRLNMINVTLYQNHGGPEESAAIYIHRGFGTMLNCILWDNDPNEIWFYATGEGRTLNIVHCDIMGGENGISVTGTGILNWLDGNITVDPLFVDPSDDDFRLLADSPCIGAGREAIEIDGTWYYAPDNDLDGMPRPDPPGSNPDMGAYESPEGVGSQEFEIGTMTNNLMIDRNYPNPFSTQTVITYHAPHVRKLALEIYDIEGHLVRSLVESSHEAGMYQVTWDGLDDEGLRVANGVYLVKLESGNNRNYRKLVVLR